MMPKHLYEEIEDPVNYEWEVSQSVGTGPYKLVEYEPGQFWRLEANTEYYAGAPTIQEIVIIKFADIAGALAAFQGGEIDTIFQSVPPEQKELLGGREDVTLIQGPLYGSQQIIYDMQTPPYDQLEFRQALSLAIDRQELVDLVYLGAATVGAPGFVHPNSPVSNPRLEQEHDPEQAKALLDQIGIVDSDGDGIREFEGQPLSLELMAHSGSALRLRMAELLMEQLEEVGLQLEVAALENKTIDDIIWPGFDPSQSSPFELVTWGWSPTILIIPSKFTWLLHSDISKGPFNMTNYESERMDALVDELAAENDPKKRLLLIYDIQEVIAEELPFLTTLYGDGIFPCRGPACENMVYIVGDGPVNKLSFLPEDARP
jgi:peptide/nickel transport system substrate-binding protein